MREKKRKKVAVHQQEVSVKDKKAQREFMELKEFREAFNAQVFKETFTNKERQHTLLLLDINQRGEREHINNISGRVSKLFRGGCFFLNLKSNLKFLFDCNKEVGRCTDIVADTIVGEMEEKSRQSKKPSFNGKAGGNGQPTTSTEGESHEAHPHSS